MTRMAAAQEAGRGKAAAAGSSSPDGAAGPAEDAAAALVLPPTPDQVCRGLPWSERPVTRSPDSYHGHRQQAYLIAGTSFHSG